MTSFVCMLAAALATGCGSDRATRGEGTLEVVATTAPLADIVRNAGGRRVRVVALVPRGANPHRYRPRAGDRAAVRGADLLVRSGGDVDGWAAGLEADRALTVLPLVDPLPGDAHWWLDPVRAQRAVKEIRNELARADVNGAGYYEAASADFLARLRKLDREITRCLLVAFPPRVRLATEHDAFAYFSDRYGVEFVELRRASEARRLWSDTLGAPASGGDTYLSAMASNAAAVVDGLSDGQASCRPPL
jgi:zinc/manganese transport system substrate-binding protein/manganese/iron transport system substrate-binding protein